MLWGLFPPPPLPSSKWGKLYFMGDERKNSLFEVIYLFIYLENVFPELLIFASFCNVSGW